MNSELVRIYKLVHTWTGLLAGMALFIAFYAGALTLFKEPLTRWASPPETAEVRSVDLDEVPAFIAKAVLVRPEVARGFTVRLAPVHPRQRVEWEAQLPGGDEHDNLGLRHYRAGLDHEGAVITEEVHRTHVAELVDVLHRVVGLPVDRDEYRLFMGAIAALYAVAIFSGVVILLPSLVKDLFALRVSPNLKRMWLDAHNVVGLFSLPFHVVMAITAAVFAFHDVIYIVQDHTIHDGKVKALLAPPPRSAPAADPKPRDPASMLAPTEIVAKVREIAPDFEPSMLQYLAVNTPRAAVRVWGRDPKRLEFRPLGGFAMVDPYGGKVLATDYLPGHQSRAGTALTSVFALHFATYGGAPLKWLYFVLAVAGAWLFYSGNLLWIETRRRKARRKDGGVIPVQRRDTRLMASGTVGVCLGSVIGISLTIASAKWLNGHVSDLNAWHTRVYYAGFFVALGWAFARGPARANVELLRAAALATFAIPLATLTGLATSALGPWATRGDAGVDGLALVASGAFFWMSRAAAKRARDGGADSVWSLNAPSSRARSASVSETDADEGATAE